MEVGKAVFLAICYHLEKTSNKKFVLYIQKFVLYIHDCEGARVLVLHCYLKCMLEIEALKLKVFPMMLLQFVTCVSVAQSEPEDNES